MGCSPQPSPQLMTGTDDHWAASAGRALLVVPDGDDVAVVLQHVEGVLERLHVEVAGAGHLGVGEAQHVAAQAMHGRFRREARARAGLVEGRQQRLVGQQVRVAPVPRDGQQVVGDLEDAEVLVARHVPQRQDVAALEASHGVSTPPPGRGLVRRLGRRAPRRRVGARRASDAAEDHGHGLVRSDEAVASERHEAGQAGGAGVVGVDAEVRSGEPVGGLDGGLVHDDAATAGQQHGPHDGQPVVGLVVEDAMGEAVPARSPRATCSRSGGWRSRAGRPPRRSAATASPAATPRRSSTRAWARASGKPPCVWTVSRRGRRSMSPAARASSKASAWAEAKAPPPTWTTRRSRAEAWSGSWSMSSQPSVAPPSMAWPLRLPWTVKGTAPAGDGSQQAVVGGVAGLSGLALADLDLRLQAAEALEDRGLGAGRHEDEQAAPGGARHDGRGQRRVAAAGDGQWGGRVGQAEVLRHPQAEHDAHEVARLVGARDVAGLVLDPDASRRAEAQAAGPGWASARRAWSGSRGRRPWRWHRQARARAPRSARRSSRPARATCQAWSRVR